MYFDEEEKRCDRVTFTNRLIIEKKFEEWCDKNSIAKTPMIMVSFMQQNNLIKIGSANEYAKRHKAILKKMNLNYTKTVLALDCARADFLLCFQQKRRRFFDHRRIHKE